jgi:hypothetical protein
MRLYVGLIDSWSALDNRTKSDDGQLARDSAGWLPISYIESRISGCLSGFKVTVCNMLFGIKRTIVCGILPKSRLSSIHGIPMISPSRDFLPSFGLVRDAYYHLIDSRKDLTDGNVLQKCPSH